MVDLAAALVFHEAVRPRARSIPKYAVLLVLAAACHRQQSERPPDEEGCTGARCVEQAEAAMYYRDYEHAREPLALVCEGGDGFACFRLAELYQHGRGGGVDVTKAAALYAESCTKDYGEGCERRADLARDGEGDPAIELEFARKACESGRPLACLRAANQLDVGRGVERDANGAIALFEKACGLGDTDGCTGAGERLAVPDGPPDGKARALTAFIKACTGHNGYGCLRVGVAFHDGLGAPKDLVKAQAHFTRACEWSVEDGCHAAKQLAAAGGESVLLELTSKAESLGQDGLEARALTCRMDEQGLPALGEVLAGVARHKAALDACAKDGAALEVRWEFDGGRVREAKLKDRAGGKLGKCVVNTLRKARIKATGTCEAVLLLGDPDGAAKALAARPPPEKKGDGRTHVRVTAEEE